MRGIKQLKDFKTRTRTNDAGSMTSVAQTISEEDIEEIFRLVDDRADRAAVFIRNRREARREVRRRPVQRHLVRVSEGGSAPFWRRRASGRSLVPVLPRRPFVLAKLRPRRPSHATVVAYLALFVALGRALQPRSSPNL